MIKYKILDSIIQKGNYSIPINSGNSDYQQFIQDVAEEGIEIVEYVNIINPSSNEVPAWVQEAADNWTFNKQLREYVAAVERLEATEDEDQRAAAQAVIDNTPQAVIDAVNSL